MPSETSIAVSLETKKRLEDIKVHPRETMDDLLNRLLQIYDELMDLDVVYQNMEAVEGLEDTVEKLKRIYKHLGKL